ncbi:MAG: lipid A oxidase, partial [Pseudorhizobium sp.]
MAVAQAADSTPVDTAFTAPASTAYFELSAYGGYQTSPHSDIDVSDQASFSAGWEGKSFSTPPYWGVRGTYWFGEGQLSDLG